MESQRWNLISHVSPRLARGRSEKPSINRYFRFYYWWKLEHFIVPIYARQMCENFSRSSANKRHSWQILAVALNRGIAQVDGRTNFDFRRHPAGFTRVANSKGQRICFMHGVSCPQDNYARVVQPSLPVSSELIKLRKWGKDSARCRVMGK